MKKLLLISIIINLLSYLNSPALAAPVKWDHNGHYYDVILARTTWDGAKLDAELQAYMGYKGHLVTLTSAEENLFVSKTFINYWDDIWLGGYQPGGSIEPGGGWRWVTNEPWYFTNWYINEPNNAGVSNENALINSSWNNYGVSWNDGRSNFLGNGYIVEYDVPVPEPTTMVLGLLGLTGVWRSRKRNKSH